MKKLKHTPGPWKFNDYYKCVQNLYQELVGICHFPKNNNFKNDACLIAAAPEMLEALIDFQNYDTIEFLEYLFNEGVNIFKDFDKYNKQEFAIVIIGFYKGWKKRKIHNEIIEKATGLKIEDIIND